MGELFNALIVVCIAINAGGVIGSLYIRRWRNVAIHAVGAIAGFMVLAS